MSDAKKTAIEALNQLLPQTQCGLCEYAGCKPYAEAIVSGEAKIDRCLPGGATTLIQLAKLTETDATPLLESMEARMRPAATAVIREDECIGCTKCIQACPVDAIIGAGKLMHTIITADCTGCELCVPPCPVDCIDIKTLAAPAYDPVRAKHQYEQKQLREQKKTDEKMVRYQEKTQAAVTETLNTASEQSKQSKQDAIAAAVARVKAKQSNTRIWSVEQKDA